MKTNPQLEYIRHQDGDVIVRCPNCKHEGPLMSDFSLLAAGFNGIKRGEPDDCNLQECGQCEAQCAWDNIPASDDASNH